MMFKLQDESLNRHLEMLTGANRGLTLPVSAAQSDEAALNLWRIKRYTCYLSAQVWARSDELKLQVRLSHSESSWRIQPYSSACWEILQPIACRENQRLQQSSTTTTTINNKLSSECPHRASNALTEKHTLPPRAPQMWGPLGHGLLCLYIMMKHEDWCHQ